MAIGESAGSVFVTIDGDVSPLIAKYAQAEAASRAAGQNVAAGFNAAASGSDLATTSVDRLIQVIQEESAAASLAAQRNAALGTSIRQVGSAAAGTVPEMAAMSGGIRTLFGEQSIRAVERFGTSVLGLGPIMQTLFPIIGAVALVEMLGKVVGRSEEAKEAEKELADATQRSDEAFAHMQSTLNQLNVEHVARKFGAAAGKGAEVQVIDQQIQQAITHAGDLRDQINEIAYAAAESGKRFIPFNDVAKTAEDKMRNVSAQIAEVNAQIQELQGKKVSIGEAQGVDAASEAGKLQSVRIAATEKANDHIAEMAKSNADIQIEQANALVQRQIAGMHDREAASVASANQEVQVAQQKMLALNAFLNQETKAEVDAIQARATAESAGKSKPEQAQISAKASGDVANAYAQNQQKQLSAVQTVVDAHTRAADTIESVNRKAAERYEDDWRKVFDDIAKGSREMTAEISRRGEEQIKIQQKVAETEDRGQGQIAALGVQRQKETLEASYAATRSHTLQQEIDFLTQISALEDQQNTLKLTGLAKDLADAQAIDDQLAAERIKIQLLKESEEAQNQAAQLPVSVAKATATNKQGLGALGNQSGAIAESGASSIANALAKGVMNGGKGIGKDISQSLKGIGQQMLGTILKDSMEQIVIAMTGNTIATEANTLVTELLSFLGFAGGTDSAPGGMAMVGEKGPEIVNLPRGSQVIPNHKISAYANGTPGHTSIAVPGGGGNIHIGNLSVHAHGINDPSKFSEHVFRTIPVIAKRRSSQGVSYST